MNGTQIMIAITGAMLLLELVLAIWLVRYMTKPLRESDTNYIAREMREYLRNKMQDDDKENEP